MSIDLEKLTSEILTLQIFDFTAEIRLDDQQAGEDLAEIYQGFLAKPALATSRKPYRITFLTSEENTSGSPALFLDGRQFTFAGKTTYRREAFALIHRTLLSRVRSHILVEGSALARGEAGLVLMGGVPDRISALITKLMKAGFQILSEGMVAFGRADQLIYPFSNPFRPNLGQVQQYEYEPIPLRKYIYLEDKAPSDGGAEAQVPKPYPESQAVIGLLNRFIGGKKSLLIKEEYDGNTTRLFLDLVNMMQQAECYQIKSAPAAIMAEQVLGLF